MIKTLIVLAFLGHATETINWGYEDMAACEAEKTKVAQFHATYGPKAMMEVGNPRLYRCVTIDTEKLQRPLEHSWIYNFYAQNDGQRPLTEYEEKRRRDKSLDNMQSNPRLCWKQHNPVTGEITCQ